MNDVMSDNGEEKIAIKFSVTGNVCVQLQVLTEMTFSGVILAVCSEVSLRSIESILQWAIERRKGNLQSHWVPEE